MKKKIVVALGGNAILSSDPTAEAQKLALEQTAKYLAKIVEKGHELIVTHGNGPQVGNLLLQNIIANSEKNPAFPLDTLVAMTEGSIGYWLQNALQKELQQLNIKKPVVSLVTQVVVDAKDPAFENPTKPIGPFYSEEEAKLEMAKSEAKYVEDAGRGWRKVVPSPKPIRIEEIESIKTLVEAGHVVIAAGGGGVPVIQNEQHLKGVEAVIDKDFASQVLASDLGADSFIVLTGVDYAYINFNKDNQERLEKVSVEQLEHYIAEQHFAKGSMLPKIEACIQFVKQTPKGKAMITSLENLKNLIEKEEGTIITI